MSTTTNDPKVKKFQFSEFDMNSLNDFKLIKQGAEGKLYLGKDENGREVIVKERFKKTYRHPDLDKSLTSKRIKNEVKLLNKAESLNVHVPTVYKADLNHGVIVMKYIENSITCREFILNLTQQNEDQDLVKRTIQSLSFRIGKIIGKLHLNEIIHGDLTTSNILIVKSDTNNIDDLKIIFIDFGLSFVSHVFEDKAVDLYVLERALLSTHSQQASEIFENILKGYVAEYGKESPKVIDRFEQVRLRGRKRTMIG